MSSVESESSRRELVFGDLSEVVAEVERLQSSSYERAGQWDLAQACEHLADWIAYPMDGFPKGPLPVRVMLWTMRKTIGPGKLRKSLDRRSIPAGMPTIPQSVAPAGQDEEAAIARLRKTIERFEHHTAPLHPSPLFGPLDHENARRMHLVHCAHHLGFLVPNGGAE